MIWGIIFLGLLIAIVILGVANFILTKIKKKKLKEKKGEEN